MQIQFEVEGKPFGKQRPRHNRNTGITYTPTETKKHEEEIAWAYRDKYGSAMFPASANIELTVFAFFPIPKAMTKADRARIPLGTIRPRVKPDGDNIYKLVADALNGVAYPDDNQIVNGTFEKHYSDKPRIVITIKEAHWLGSTV